MKAKKILCSALAGVIAAGVFSISAFADNEKQMSVTVRIEGISKNLYYNTVDIPYTGENLTVQNALMYVDQQSDDITITGLENGWITAVNDEKQASFGGWDGWLYTVNGVSPTDTVNDHMLSDGDSIVLYYGDPYGIGMQYPEIDTSKITDGILTFTSKDTSYDTDYNPTVVTNPVKDAKVELGTEDGSISYTTDENGSINIDDKYLTEGNHSISISKVSENGLPLVLRFAPDRTVAFPSKPQKPSNESSESSNESSKPESISQESTKPSEPSAVSQDGKVPSTGDSSALTVVILTASAAFAVILTARKRNHEK